MWQKIHSAQLQVPWTVAANETEAGRARNRRVVLMKQ
jgi:hypothetical protein